jgi:hypothetical protein
MNQSIVLQLQELASDDGVKISEVLRKALMVATKLNLEDFRNWVILELNGYRHHNMVPPYRLLFGNLNVKNPYHGLVRFFLPPDVAELVQTLEVTSSCDEINSLIVSDKHNGTIWSSFPPEKEKLLMDFQTPPAFAPVLVIPVNQFYGIIQTVRTKILDWALSLERQGIIGTGITFSEKERKLAMTHNSITIENFQGVLGDVSGGTISQTNSITVSPNDLQSLANFLVEKGVEKNDIQSLEIALRADPPPVSSKHFGPQVSNWIGKMITKAATGGWEIGVAVAGGILSGAISKYYGL